MSSVLICSPNEERSIVLDLGQVNTHAQFKAITHLRASGKNQLEHRFARTKREICTDRTH